MTTGGINSGWFLPTFMEIVFLVSNVSYKPKLLQLFFFLNQYLNCGEERDLCQRKHSQLIVFAHGTAMQFVARPRENPQPILHCSCLNS